MATAKSRQHCYCQRRRSYKQMVQDIAENLGAEDVQKIVFCHDLPAEFSNKPALAALRQLEVQGQFSDADTERLESLLKGIYRYDLIDRHVMHYRRNHCSGARGSYTCVFSIKLYFYRDTCIIRYNHDQMSQRIYVPIMKVFYNLQCMSYISSLLRKTNVYCCP